MSVIYDPHHPMYLDEADTRGELSRVFNVCNGCRKCVTLCPTFPSLFTLLADSDAGLMTPAQQDHVSEQCHQCKMCAVQCPYTPNQHELAIDVPRLMLRATAMRRAAGLTPWRQSAVTAVLGRANALGAVTVAMKGLAARSVGTAPGTVMRKIAGMARGESRVRLLPSFARTRFSTWFAQRAKVRLARPQGKVSVFPTCMVEYHTPSIGRALVQVYEHNGISCSLSDARCCGAPLLNGGDVQGFVKVAVDNVATLAAEVRAGNSIVVPQPTCGLVIKRDYLDYVGGPEATLVARNTYDACEYLMKVHNAEGTSLDTRFPGTVHDNITYHSPCHLRAQGDTRSSRDLMKLTGARVNLIERCAGAHGAPTVTAARGDSLSAMADQLGTAITQAHGDVVVGDCHQANTTIGDRTAQQPLHPLQVLAAAYGIDVLRDEH